MRVSVEVDRAKKNSPPACPWQAYSLITNDVVVFACPLFLKSTDSGSSESFLVSELVMEGRIGNDCHSLPGMVYVDLVIVLLDDECPKWESLRDTCKNCESSFLSVVVWSVSARGNPLSQRDSDGCRRQVSCSLLPIEAKRKFQYIPCSVGLPRTTLEQTYQF